MAETAGTTTLSREQRYQETRRVTVVGGIIDLLLGVVKIIVGEFAHSQALIADGVHSLSDLATDVMLIWAAKHASREPDALHPYGHQRIETVTSIVLGVVLTVVAVGLAWDAVNTMLERETPLIAGPAALFVAWWSTRSGRLKPVFSCVLATVLSVSLYLMPHPAAFVAACIGFGIFFSLAFPYIIGVSTEMDNLGQVAAVAGFISSLGLATGPAIAAALVGESRYELVVLFALGSLLASALLIIYPARLLDSRSKQGRVQWPAGAMAEPVTRPGVSH